MVSGREKFLSNSRSLGDKKVPSFTKVLTDHVVREGATVALQVAVRGRW